jgi:outer membrane protein, heavy metal efflux system
MMSAGQTRYLIAAAFLLTALSGCALHPPGEFDERRRAEAVTAYGVPTGEVQLPQTPSLEEYLQYAFHHNAELEARYYAWRAALEQIPQDASPPNPVLTFDYMFSSANMKAWDRTTIGAANEPMSMIPFPSKLATAGRRALEATRAAGLRFEGAKFQLQGAVLSTYYDLALLTETIRIAEENVSLLRLILSQASVQVQTGVAAQQDLLKAQTELDLAQNELENLRSQSAPLKAKFNVLLGRPADASVSLPKTLPAPRPLPVPDGELIRIAAERSPELQALAREVSGQEHALSLAKQAYIPDFGVSANFTGSVSQSIGAMLTLPLRLEAIQAGIEQARAGIRAAQAAKRQYERDLAASFVLNLAVLRNNERQVALFETTIIPRARQAVAIAQTAYATNRVDFGELLEAQRMLIDTRLAAAQLKTEREKALAAIETWSAVDAEVMNRQVFSMRSM